MSLRVTRVRCVACLATMAFCIGLSASALAAPPNGTPIQTRFCGRIYDLDPRFEPYGLSLDAPYLAELNLVQRAPDEYPDVDWSQWDCESPNEPCGELRIDFLSFVPPQTDPDPSDVFGPIAEIDQTSLTYRAYAILDDFVPGAIGEAELQLFCVGCGRGNDINSIDPAMGESLDQTMGTLTVQMQVPGIGGSQSPPSGANPNFVYMSVDALGGRCNQFLPASSPKGLIALVVLMIAAVLFLARDRSSSAVSKT
jgi:hypothetical protein